MSSTTASRIAAPRWAWLLALPLLAGAVLLMHGLDAHAGDSHPGSATELGAHPHGSDATVPHHAPVDDAHCEDCLAGHVMAACIAVVASVATLALGRRLRDRLTWSRTHLDQRPSPLGGVEAPPPLEPAWVRLAVMRC